MQDSKDSRGAVTVRGQEGAMGALLALAPWAGLWLLLGLWAPRFLPLSLSSHPACQALCEQTYPPLAVSIPLPLSPSTFILVGSPLVFPVLGVPIVKSLVGCRDPEVQYGIGLLPLETSFLDEASGGAGGGRNLSRAPKKGFEWKRQK